MRKGLNENCLVECTCGHLESLEIFRGCDDRPRHSLETDTYLQGADLLGSAKR